MQQKITWKYIKTLSKLLGYKTRFSKNYKTIYYIKDNTKYGHTVKKVGTNLWEFIYWRQKPGSKYEVIESKGPYSTQNAKLKLLAIF